jgi:predicted nucleotidyltransferase
MRPSEILEHNREKILATLSRHPEFVNLRVFGSVAKKTDKEGSDIDFVVDALSGATLMQLSRLQMELQNLLGVSVDILTSGAEMNDLLKRSILEDSVQL